MAKSRGTSEVVKTSDYPAENLQKEYVGFGPRLLSYVIDAAIIFFIGFLIQRAFGVNYLLDFWNAKTLSDFADINAFMQSKKIILNLIGLLVPMVYFILFWTLNDGQSPGKKLIGIRIKSKDDASISFSAALIRYIGFLISSFLLGVGFFWIFFDKEKQGIHDKVAGTVVVWDTRKNGVGIFIAIVCIALFIIMYGIVAYKTVIYMDELMKASVPLNMAEGFKVTNLTQNDDFDIVPDEIDIDNILNDSIRLIEDSNQSLT